MDSSVVRRWACGATTGETGGRVPARTCSPWITPGGPHGPSAMSRGALGSSRDLTLPEGEPNASADGASAEAVRGRRRQWPLSCRSYRGMHLLRAYRAHPDYGRLPLVLVAVAPPHNLGGAGPIEVVETHTVPAAVVAAVDRLLQPTGQTPDRPLLTTTG